MRGMQQAFEVAGDEVHFKVDARTGAHVGKGGARLGVRHDVDVEGVAVHAVDGEADTVHGDGAFPHGR